MSPRHALMAEKERRKTAVKSGPSMDRERHLEDFRHHPMDNPLPRMRHKTLHKPVLPQRHTPHSHPHGDELPAHTHQPMPIRPLKNMAKIRIWK